MELRSYQQAAVDAVWEAIRARKANPLLVLPTGSGKSLVIAELCRVAWEQWGGRSIVLCHRKELIQQNAAKIQSLLPGADVGLYSAGLRQRETEAPVIVAGIQSVSDLALEFGGRQLVIVDEAHLISPREGSRYQTFFETLRIASPKFRLIGLTATPFRTGEGEVTDNGIFSEISYEAQIEELINAGYLAEVTNKLATTIDTSGVQVRNGEFVAGQAERAFMAGNLVSEACGEIVVKTGGRRSIVVFCCGVDHAYAVTDALSQLSGERVGLVVGDTPALERETTIRDFRAGTLRWLVNVDVLTTGFDAPNIDAIAVLRPTKSAGLFAQMCGRGFRTCEGKQDCLVLDFGGNADRHGCLDDPLYGRDKGSPQNAKVCEECDALNRPGATNCKACGAEFQDLPEIEAPPTKECPSCKYANALAARSCEACGTAFPGRDPAHATEADQQASLLTKQTRPKVTTRVAVIAASWQRHKGKQGKRDTCRIVYEVQALSEEDADIAPRFVSEWLCPEHEGYPRRKFEDSWDDMSRATAPDTIDEAISLWQRGATRCPVFLALEQDGPHWKILDRDYDEECPDLWQDEKATQTQGGDGWDADLPF